MRGRAAGLNACPGAPKSLCDSDWACSGSDSGGLSSPVLVERKGVDQHAFTDVPGLGDESHEEDFALFFRKGSTWVALRLTSLHDFSTFKPRLEALGKDVASRV